MMNRNTFFTRALIGVVVVLLAAPMAVFAQGNETNKAFSQQELDQMLAPIALYPDALLAQVLIAATYPSQVVEADRWVKDNKNLSQDELNAALDKMDWDLSVKALAPFPQVLAMMDEHLDWTTKLGEAFLAQQTEVMDRIQLMRSKAYAKGNLKTTEQQKVVVEGDNIEIQPANPEQVYVPYYDPTQVYGDWWWPGYAPFAYFPFWGPYLAWGPFGFGIGIGVGPFWGWGWGAWNWGGRDININVNRHANINDRHGHFSRSSLRTSSFHQVASRRAAGIGRTSGTGRTGAGGRPSTASVQRSLSHGRTGLSRGAGGARGTGNVSRGGARGTGNVSRGGARGTGNVARGGARRDTDVMRGGSRGMGNAARSGGFHGGGGHGGGGGFHGGGGHGGGGGGRHR